MSRMFLGAALLVAMTSTYSGAADTADFLKQGDPIGAFTVTKVAGAEDDGVEAGESLCYRCRYGSRPMVMVFTHDAGDGVAKLVKELDSAVASHSDAQLKGLVTLLGENQESLKEKAGKIVQSSGAKHVPVVIAEEAEHGPQNYNLDDSVEVTVVVANDSQVVATHTYQAANIDIKQVMSDVQQMLN